MVVFLGCFPILSPENNEKKLKKEAASLAGTTTGREKVYHVQIRYGRSMLSRQVSLTGLLHPIRKGLPEGGQQHPAGGLYSSFMAFFLILSLIFGLFTIWCQS